jgi:hypothetical protein
MALSSTFQKKILSNICPPKVERKMVLMPKANNSPTFGGKMHSVRSSQLCFLEWIKQTLQYCNFKSEELSRAEKQYLNTLERVVM